MDAQEIYQALAGFGVTIDEPITVTVTNTQAAILQVCMVARFRSETKIDGPIYEGDAWATWRKIKKDIFSLDLGRRSSFTFSKGGQDIMLTELERLECHDPQSKRARTLLVKLLTNAYQNRQAAAERESMRMALRQIEALEDSAGHRGTSVNWWWNDVRGTDRYQVAVGCYADFQHMMDDRKMFTSKVFEITVSLRPDPKSGYPMHSFAVGSGTCRLEQIHDIDTAYEELLTQVNEYVGAQISERLKDQAESRQTLAELRAIPNFDEVRHAAEHQTKR